VPDRRYEIEVGNLELIEACWGVPMAAQAVDHVRQRLAQWGFRAEQGDRPQRFRITDDLCSQALPGCDPLGDLAYRLTAEPIVPTGGPPDTVLHAVVTWQSEDPPRYRNPRDIQRDYGAAWIAQYRQDMALVADAFRCAREGQMAPHWQPVCDYRDPTRILYHEGLVRFGEAGAALYPGILFPALERTGMASTFDRIMVGHVLDALRSDRRATLAVNVSANSAHRKGWWRGILAELAAQPDLASRLVVEITETEPIVHIEEAVAFAQALRATGATLALDDFGAGYTSIRQLMVLVPALVKIDGLFVQRATDEGDGGDGLRHLIGLVRALGGIVVIEGVETQAMADLAYASGATWQQGYLHGRPSPVRCRPKPKSSLASIMARQRKFTST